VKCKLCGASPTFRLSDLCEACYRKNADAWKGKKPPDLCPYCKRSEDEHLRPVKLDSMVCRSCGAPHKACKMCRKNLAVAVGEVPDTTTMIKSCPQEVK
jgi:hypothetical protein